MNSRPRLFAVALMCLVAPAALAELVETEIAGVSTELVELRTSGGVTRLAVRYVNQGNELSGTSRFGADKVALVDVKSKQKHSPLKDANGQFVAGPIGDAIDGGRIYVKLPAGGHGVAWAYFEAIPAGTIVSVELPQMFPFEDVAVTEGPGKLLEASAARSIPQGAAASLVSAKRADQTLKARLKLAAEPGAKVDLRSPYFMYNDVYLFDTAGKRRYPLLKDAEGIFQATPLGQKIEGGSFIPDWSKPVLMSLTFQAPPDDVKTVDLVLPDFLPMEAIAIEGLGGAGAGGVAAAGKTLGLEGAIKELAATVSPEEVAVDLSADVLFDFDKAELKPAAQGTLENLLTIVKSRPGAQVLIEGHTDLRGEEAYNQALSESRAGAVGDWLVAHGVEPSRITATGAGKSRPQTRGTTEADHQRNRRVEIRIKHM